MNKLTNKGGGKKGPTDGGHTGAKRGPKRERSTRRSTQTDAPGPAAATPAWNNTGPRWTGGGPEHRTRAHDPSTPES
jgi:hypothetical protein